MSTQTQLREIDVISRSEWNQQAQNRYTLPSRGEKILKTLARWYNPWKQSQRTNPHDNNDKAPIK